jgi:hypothetical protein
MCLRRDSSLFLAYFFGFVEVYVQICTGLRRALTLQVRPVNSREGFNALLPQIETDEFLFIDRGDRLAPSDSVECTATAKEEPEQ